MKGNTPWAAVEQEPAPPSYNTLPQVQTPVQYETPVRANSVSSVGQTRPRTLESSASSGSFTESNSYHHQQASSLGTITDQTMALPAPTTSASFTHKNVRISTVALAGKDKIRLIGTPAYLTPELRIAIQSSWGTIQRESSYGGSHEFKLQGNPWGASPGPDLVRSQRLILAILEAMARLGWDLVLSTDISQRQRDQDTLYFEQNATFASDDANSGDGTKAPSRTANVEMFAVCFHKSDKIRVLAMAIPQTQKVTALVKQAVASQWKYKIQRERDYCGVFELKLQGNPFWSGGEEFVQGRMVLAQMLANFRAEGYRVYGSVCIGPGSEDDQVDFWIFRRADLFWG
ncbi:hypothetical protein EMPS_03956 [Entomortierella parvispora]|uniref:Uncharacterized protein n=1 Tax=Entomortierella parvispora TaxID=205924 RepID=A0A9P3LUX5_9FUNG|nr:hypothetical protein EMPS_03956 [Entomortierella parvispora]